MKSEVEQLRDQIGEAAARLVVSYISGDWVMFHFRLGEMYGLTARLYEANAKEERGVEE